MWKLQNAQQRWKEIQTHQIHPGVHCSHTPGGIDHFIFRFHVSVRFFTPLSDSLHVFASVDHTSCTGRSNFEPVDSATEV